MALLSSSHATLELVPARRQFRSCDNCRSRRKKCDAWAFGINPPSPRGSYDLRSCTACAKLGRTCTFIWLSQRKRSRASAEVQRSKGALSIEDQHSNAIRIQDGHDPNPSTFNAPLILPRVDKAGTQKLPSAQLPCEEVFSQHWKQHDISIPIATGARNTSFTSSPEQWATFFEQAEDVSHGDDSQTRDLKESTTGIDMNVSADFFAPSTLNSVTSRSIASPSHVATLNLANTRLSACANKSSITEILVNIYRANLEGILSSWSTAVTCPYTSPSSQLAASTANCRITFYDRAKRMDNSLTRLGLDQVVSSTRSHRGMESDTLNKVILAFASQWDSTSLEQHNDGQDPFAQTLQAIMHKTLWNDAHKGLQKVAGVTGSFRIILARLIFSFIQNPLDSVSPKTHLAADEPCYVNYSGTDNDTCGGVCSSIVTDPDCSTQMEMALRDLLHWRRQLHARLCTVAELGEPLPNDFQLFLEDFNTLFWLSVMCDTTASAISGRPLVVSDNDCAIEHIELAPNFTLRDWNINEDTFSRSCSSTISRKKRTPLWKSVLHKEINGEAYLNQSNDITSLESIIKGAVPLKVLLFRHISSLQVLIDERAADYRIENTIQDILLVCRQWQSKYGDFMDNCVNNYATMPHHLRSWHTILVAHWHYGVMLFAEKVKRIDRLQLGKLHQQRGGSAPETPTSLAFLSALQVATLAQCSLKTSQDPHIFHDWVYSRLVMLCEPWCEIMVRCLAMTAETLLERYISFPYHYSEHCLQPNHEHITACIEVLEQMGACRYQAASRIAQTLKEGFIQMS